MKVSNTAFVNRVYDRPILDADGKIGGSDHGHNHAFAGPPVSDNNSSKSIVQLDTEARGIWSHIAEQTTDLANAVTELLRVRELYETTDAQSPSLVTDQSTVLAVSVSAGDEQSSLIDLGEGVKIFVVTEAGGKQVAYRVENGEVTTRIPDGEKVDLGSGRWVRGGADNVSVLFGVSSSYAKFNSDLSQLTVAQDTSWSNSYREETYDVASGTPLVQNGSPILANMTTQQQFDFYANTVEGQNILDLEGNVYGSEAAQLVFVARVRYSREEGGAELFNEFTPRRAGLTGQDLQQYDAEVEKVMDYMREIAVNTIDGNIVEAEQIDESMLYMLASAVVESHGASPARIDTVIADIDESWIVSIDNADFIPTGTGAGAGPSAGWYNSEKSTIQVSLEDFVDDYSEPSDSFDILAHELAHSLDISDGSADGIPSGLSAENVQILTDERARLFELAYPGQAIDLSVNQDTDTVVDNSGIRNYAYTNELEFWAVISGQFLSSDSGAAQLKVTSPELYNVLREYYGREDLPEAV